MREPHVRRASQATSKRTLAWFSFSRAEPRTLSTTQKLSLTALKIAAQVCAFFAGLSDACERAVKPAVAFDTLGGERCAARCRIAQRFVARRFGRAVNPLAPRKIL